MSINTLNFNDSSTNTADVSASWVQFNGASVNSGSVYSSSGILFTDTSVNDGVVDAVSTQFGMSAINAGTVDGNAVFLDSSSNTGTVEGNATIADTATDTGTVQGNTTSITVLNAPTVALYVIGSGVTVQDVIDNGLVCYAGPELNMVKANETGIVFDGIEYQTDANGILSLAGAQYTQFDVQNVFGQSIVFYVSGADISIGTAVSGGMVAYSDAELTQPLAGYTFVVDSRHYRTDGMGGGTEGVISYFTGTLSNGVYCIDGYETNLDSSGNSFFNPGTAEAMHQGVSYITGTYTTYQGKFYQGGTPYTGNMSYMYYVMDPVYGPVAMGADVVFVDGIAQ